MRKLKNITSIPLIILWELGKRIKRGLILTGLVISVVIIAISYLLGCKKIMTFFEWYFVLLDKMVGDDCE